MKRGLREPTLRWTGEEFEARCSDCKDKKQACYWPITREFWDPRNLQRCRACNKDRRRKIEVSSYRRLYQAEYRRQTAEVQAFKSREYYAANRDEVKARNRVYYEAHRETILERARERYAKQRDLRREQAQRRYRQKRDVILAHKREKYAAAKAA